MTQTTNNRISDLINSEVPFFVRNEHPNFVMFLEAYYEFLEQSQHLLERSDNILDYRDVDKTIDEFSDHLYNSFLEALPKDIKASKDIVIKHIIDFYRTRGSEKSLSFLLRILYDKESSVYYPKTDVLRASDGKWHIQKSLRVSNTSINHVANTNLLGLEKFINRRITGNTSNASATVERVDRFYEFGIQIDELIISSIDGNFKAGEMIYTVYDDIIANSYINTGIVEQLRIINPGKGYSVNDPLIFESDSGTGATAYVSETSSGNVSNIQVLYSGAGFLDDDYLSIVGTGTNANAQIKINANNQFHKNTFTIFNTKILDLADTPINANLYPNLNTTIVSSPNANSIMNETLQSFVYGPTGPIDLIILNNPGIGYTSFPSITVSSNSMIRELGILGRIDINEGGVNYSVGDILEFINVSGGTGSGASANVKSVNGTGAITSVEFVSIFGLPEGGIGYSQNFLPVINVASNTGSSANLTTTSILGRGATFISSLGTGGQILKVTLVNKGSGYISSPYINLKSYGDGTANIVADTIQGIYSYPGRYLNDDGHLSSTNYLQNRDYYQSFSYEVIISESITKYRKILTDILHPAGIKLFGVYEKETII